MKKLILNILVFLAVTGYSQTPITDDNFYQAIDSCLSTNPVDGLCYNCEFGAMPDWDVSNVTDMRFAFGYEQVFNADISDWDVSNVTKMNGMFWFAEAFNQDISNWITTNVVSMDSMFLMAKEFNQNIGIWDVSNVQSMDIMLYYTESLYQDLSDWCVEQIPNQPVLFSTGSALPPEYHPHWGEECDSTVFVNQHEMLYPNHKIIKLIDFTGREIREPSKGVPYIEVYDDGSTRKRMGVK